MEKVGDRVRVNGERRGERECEWKKRERERVNGGRGRERERALNCWNLYLIRFKWVTNTHHVSQ